ncbi:MAG: hypothetical protein K2K70_06345 [Lachnospiraceae bacterium]|nr:hypothetical protein [Lachnospiraceae bacterium]
MITLEEAKEMFLKYDCSLFAMAREDQPFYEEYQMLNISKEVQEKWRQELFDQLKGQLKSKGSVMLFDRLYELAENGYRYKDNRYGYNRERLLALKEALAFVKYDNLRDNAIISETIIGRTVLSARHGMIFWAYDLGEYEIAKELVLYTMDLLSYQPEEDRLRDRFERDRTKCSLINSELQLGCFD